MKRKPFPNVLVLRQMARQRVNGPLVLHAAAAAGQRACIWTNTHTLGSGADPSPALKSGLMNLTSDHTDGVGATGYFFPGARYVFTQSICPPLRFVNNNGCTAVSIVLDRLEDPDDGKPPCRQLKYPPRAIFVRPDGAASGAMDIGGPPGCVPILPITSAKIKPLVPKGTKAVTITRTGLPLGDGYAVTDYYTQGMSFGSAPWAIHLTPPPTGAFQRASVFVSLSRYSSFDDVHLLHPLWPPGNDKIRKEVYAKFKAAAIMDPELVQELGRLRRIATANMEGAL